MAEIKLNTISTEIGRDQFFINLHLDIHSKLMKRTTYFIHQYSGLSHLFLTAILVVMSFILFAQQPLTSTITLKSGLVIRGEIVKMEQNEFVEVKTPIGTTLRVEWVDIQSLDFTSTPVYREPQKISYDYNDSSYYFSLSGGFPFGLDSWGDPSLGLSATAVFGKSFGQRVNCGLLAGYDFYQWPNTGVIPLGIEYRGRVHKTGFTPFYYAQTGYGLIGFSDLERGQELGETKGGLFFAPGLGLMGKKREHSSWFVQFGFKMQQTHSSYWEVIWDGGNAVDAFIEETITFRRIDLKFGYVFD